jgi:hypothetical protein
LGEVAGMTIYMWLGENPLDITANDVKSKIKSDMLIYIIASSWGNKDTNIKGVSLGSLLKLPYKIKNLTKKEKFDYEDNTPEAKKVFKEILNSIKAQSLKKSLKDTNYLGDDLGQFEDITLCENDLRDFLMQDTNPSLSRNGNTSIKPKDLFQQGYEQSFEDFITVVNNDDFTYNFEDDGRKVTFNFELEYNETTVDNTKELRGSNITIVWEDVDYKWEVSRNQIINIDDVRNWHEKDIMKSKILHIIYTGFKKDTKHKEAILSPAFVTPFKISGSLSGQGLEDFIYNGTGNTTHKLKNPLSLEMRAFPKKPWASLPVESVPRHPLKDKEGDNTKDTPEMERKTQKELNLIISDRNDLIRGIQGKIFRLDKAIEAL